MLARGSIKLMTIRGIDVHVHLSFLLMVAWGAWEGANQYGDPFRGAMFGAAAMILLFGCVLLHELGHSLHAIDRGIGVRHIVLLPIGGVAGMESLPESPGDEFLVAMAGPMANLGVALMLTGLLAGAILPNTGDPLAVLMMAMERPSALGMLVYLALANWALLLFNLLPAFPMDGGRVVRVVLALILPYDRATLGASLIGQTLAVTLILIGLVGLQPLGIRLGPSLSLALVGVIVFVGAVQENRMVRWYTALTGFTVEDACKPAEWTLSPADRISQSLAERVFESQPVLPVMVENRLVGVLTRQDAYAALRRSSPGNPMTAAHVMRTDFPIVRRDDPLWVAHELLRKYHLDAIPVMNQRHLYGMIGLDDIRHVSRNLPSYRKKRSVNNMPYIGGIEKHER